MRTYQHRFVRYLPWLARSMILGQHSIPNPRLLQDLVVPGRLLCDRRGLHLVHRTIPAALPSSTNCSACIRCTAAASTNARLYRQSGHRSDSEMSIVVYRPWRSLHMGSPSRLRRIIHCSLDWTAAGPSGGGIPALGSPPVGNGDVGSPGGASFAGAVAMRPCLGSPWRGRCGGHSVEGASRPARRTWTRSAGACTVHTARRLQVATAKHKCACRKHPVASFFPAAPTL